MLKFQAFIGHNIFQVSEHFPIHSYELSSLFFKYFINPGTYQCESTSLSLEQANNVYVKMAEISYRSSIEEKNI